MEEGKQKYIQLPEYDQFIFFPIRLDHSDFKSFNPISAGFCVIDSDKNCVKCFGEAFSLGLEAGENDSQLATKQVFGVEAMMELME